jgi:hypothetical protein
LLSLKADGASQDGYNSVEILPERSASPPEVLLDVERPSAVAGEELSFYLFPTRTA